MTDRPHIEQQPFSDSPGPDVPMPKTGEAAPSFSDRPQILEELQRHPAELAQLRRETRNRNPQEVANDMARAGVSSGEMGQFLQAAYPHLQQDLVGMGNILGAAERFRPRPGAEGAQQDPLAPAPEGAEGEAAQLARDRAQANQRAGALASGTPPPDLPALPDLNKEAGEIMNEKNEDEKIEKASDFFNRVFGSAKGVTWKTAEILGKTATIGGIGFILILVLFFLLHSGKAGQGGGG